MAESSLESTESVSDAICGIAARPNFVRNACVRMSGHEINASHFEIVDVFATKAGKITEDGIHLLDFAEATEVCVVFSECITISVLLAKSTLHTAKNAIADIPNILEGNTVYLVVGVVDVVKGVVAEIEDAGGYRAKSSTL